MLSKFSRSSLNQLEIELIDAGKKLLHLSSLTEDIQNVLAKLKRNLSKVEQKPSDSMKYALRPVMEALVVKELVTHPDLDVNISVSCCFCEILRICAPDSPYNDEQLKDLFDVVVVTFEKLSCVSGGCYMKMRRVLEIFSRNGLSGLMLDLQLGGAGLVVRLFKQFLTVAESNPSAIVLEMEKIMTMIIEDSVALKLELVDRLVTLLKNINQIASHDFWQPGETVLMNFAARFKPHFPERRRNMSNDHYDYSTSVASICEAHMIKTECPETATVTEVKGKRKRNNSPLEKQVSSSEDGGTVCVQGYEVKRSIAQILEAVFEKHGDIAANCVFKTSSMTSSILEVVCEVVRRIQTNEVVEKMEETLCQVSDAEAVNIDVAWLQADLEAIRKKMQALKRSNFLKKTTKGTLLAERAARTDLKETDAKVVAAREQIGWAERLANVLDIVEKNLDGKILECKGRMDSWVQQPFLQAN